MVAFIHELPVAVRVSLTLIWLVAMTLAQYLLLSKIAGQPLSRKKLLLFGAFFFPVSLLQRAIAIYVDTLFGLALTIAMYCAIAWFVFQKRGAAWIVLAIKFMISAIVVEAVCTAFLLLLVSMGVPYELMLWQGETWLTDPIPAFFNIIVITIPGILLIYEILRLIDRIRNGLKRKNRTERMLYAGVCIRLAALITLGVGTLLFATMIMIPKILATNFLENYYDYVLLVILVAGLLIVAISYLAQDLRYIAQLKRNDTLERQRAISRSLLANLRFFRHNMINMLYGFEGAIIEGDAERLQAYYSEMTKKCALVNNENIVALERVADSSISAVLLNALERARQEELPVNLYVQEGTQIAHSIATSDLCQLVGVLLDNALDAAAMAQEKFVLISLRNVDGMMELLVKNTYTGTISEAQLNQGGVSNKPGHQGDGLISCYSILERSRAAFLNFTVSSQYVQAQLMAKMS